MGGTSMEDSGAQRSGAQVDITDPSPTPPQPPSAGTNQGDLGGVIMENGSARQPTSDSEYDLTSAERQEFHSAAASIRQAWQAMPELTDYQDNILVEVTEDGLDIQILDQKGRRMFPEGSKYPIEATRAAIAAIAPILQRLNMQISISGHTAAGGRYPNPRYGAWELSSDRANVVRGILGEFGLSEDHIKSVIGRATDQPFFPNDAFMAANERVHITVRRDAPPVPVGLAP
jgi:chemotaxis protein MotB